MRMRRQKDGSLTLRFSGPEAAVLRELAAELRAHVENPDFTKRAVQRLFPRYADDDKTNEELRQLLLEDQRKQKLERTEAFAAALGKIPAKGGDVVLPQAEIEHWLALLTDLRFIYAATIGIEDDNWGHDIDPRNPPSREVVIYLYLTDLQQALLDGGFGVGYERDWRRPR
jgi:hypothetical protein